MSLEGGGLEFWKTGNLNIDKSIFPVTGNRYPDYSVLSEFQIFSYLPPSHISLSLLSVTVSLFFDPK